MDVIYALQHFASPMLDHLFMGVSKLGSQYFYIVLLCICYLAIDARYGQRVGMLVTFGFCLNFHLKWIFDTPRPYELDPSVGRPDLLTASREEGGGFPSAHVQVAVMFWGYNALRFGKKWFWALAVGIVFLMSLSRMYLGVHFLGDVLGGVILGTLCLVFMVYAEPVWRSFRLLSKRWRLVLALGVPLLILFLAPPPAKQSTLVLAGFAGFASAPTLMPYKPPKSWLKRGGIALLGIFCVLLALVGSSLLLPEAVKAVPFLSFLRYLGVSYIGFVLVPFVVQQLGLAPRPTPLKRLVPTSALLEPDL